MKFAALDLGSNSFLCLIGEGNADGIQIIYEDQVEIVRLGEGLSKSSVFSEEALLRAKKTLTSFKSLIDQHQVQKVLAVATAAARDATNQNDFLKICEDLSIPIRIISGQDEAALTYKGVLSFVQGLDSRPVDQKGANLVIDIGGRSTEFIYGIGTSQLVAKSLPLGCVSLTEKFATFKPLRETVIRQMSIMIQNAFQNLTELLAKQSTEKKIILRAVAGTPTTLAAMKHGGFSVKKIENSVLSQAELQNWVDELGILTTEQIVEKYKISAKRADVLFVGAFVLLEFLKYFKETEVFISTKGLRFGVALEMIESEKT